ncbi:Ribosomal biogenesis protein las1l [Boothiomyces macroporosus]|uniref:Ribosomal biogenesis protein las1l n=1 Tax=Boothiomyces macroporosus TaxID=261099 RepID=A0AAD5YBF5_9FUNG|nr:Ribosomal biogenesis protein las1l [Boothiomyces macroporosus]
MRFTPWIDIEEWKETFEYLYSPDTNKQKLGVNRVKAWASRGKLPHSIESTSLFVEIGMQDQPSRYSTCSSREISLLISMAIIRFVNGLIDSLQRGYFANSQTNIAEQIGLPLWFVELRHSATHDKLPSLEYLRRGRIQALQWLRENYWEKELAAPEVAKQKISNIVESYLSDGTGLNSIVFIDSHVSILISIITEKINDQNGNTLCELVAYCESHKNSLAKPAVPSDLIEVEVSPDTLECELQELKDRIQKKEAVISIDQDDVNWGVVEWKSCPIGALDANGVPDLSLDERFDDMVWLNEQGFLSIPVLHYQPQVPVAQPVEQESIKFSLL